MPSLIDAIRKHHSAAAGDAELRLKPYVVKTPTIDREQRLVKGVVSSAAPDMDEEVVVPQGLSRAYFPKAVKAVYLNHNYSELPVGTCRALGIKDGALFASTFITTRAIGDDLLTAIDEGAVNGFSVGFRVDECGPPTVEETKQYGRCRTIIRKATLMEYSITAMPANPEALVNLVSKSLIRRESARAFGMIEDGRTKATRTGRRAVIGEGGLVWIR